MVDAKSLGLAFSVHEYPRTDGSTSAQPLGAIVACKLTGRPYQWVSFRGFDKSRYIAISTQQAISPADDSDLLPLQHKGTHDAYVDLIEGKVDLIYECRTPSADEAELARQRHVELDIREIALDAFIFMVNAENSVKGLTLQQVRDIYTGKLTNWKELGGADEPIMPRQRERNSGSQEVMESLVMKGLKMVPARDTIAWTMAGPFNLLESQKRALGYSFHYYEHFMLPTPNVTPLAIDGVAPSAQTIASRKYPLTTAVYAVLRKDTPKDHAARRLADWLLTPQGQEVVAASGYAPAK
jgi:phosphate transport system substrate-binding protein